MSPTNLNDSTLKHYILWGTDVKHTMATDLVYSPDPGSFVQQQPDTLLIATSDSSQQGGVFILQGSNKQILIRYKIKGGDQ